MTKTILKYQKLLIPLLNELLPKYLLKSHKTTSSITFVIVTDKEHRGKVIGKDGRVYKGLSSIIGAIAGKHKDRVYLEVYDPEEKESL